MSETPTKTKELENQYLVSIVTELLSETGELGTLTKDQLTALSGKKGGIRHELSKKPESERSNYGYDILKEIYSPKTYATILELKKRFIQKHGKSMDEFLSDEVLQFKGGRSRKQSMRKRKGKGKGKSRGKKRSLQ